MSGLTYKKLGSTLSNICNTTQLDDATKCHYAFKNFWGEPCYVQTCDPRGGANLEPRSII